MRTLTDRAVRVELGIPRVTAARLAGVSPNTLAIFEAAPHAIRDDKRDACAALYKLLRYVLEHAPTAKKGAA